MSISKNIFKLKKHYADLIDDSGNCFIVYHAELEFFFIHFYYGALIFSDSGDTIYQASTYIKTSIQQTSEEFYFHSKKLGIEGKWMKSGEGILLHLYKDQNKHELIWNCHHPKAKTEIYYNDNAYRGLGYAETLTLTLKPGNLPFVELYWGRYLSDTDCIIWIIWKGSYPVNRLFYNNQEYNDTIIEDDRIVFGNGAFQLVFRKISILRKGELSEVLARMPWLKVLFKRNILNSIENKYKAKSHFYKELKEVSAGWSIYESVQWKK